jgi:Fe-S-cluster-containing dehydrogenase component
MTLAIRDGAIRGLFVTGQNPVVGGHNSGMIRKALANLEWMVVRETFENETASFWYRSPEVEKGELRPEDIKTEIFLMPAALPGEKEGTFTNTHRLIQWHRLIQPAAGARGWGEGGERVTDMPPFQSNWLMASDVCKHCAHAGCVEACPTGALFYTEFGTVVVQQDVCNGCGYCVPSCPFGVVELSFNDGLAHKCTLCYDRLHGGLEPACAKSCPTDSIQFGKLKDLQARARRRVEDLHARGEDKAYLYGAPDSPGATDGIGQLNAFFLLLDRPEVYNLPAEPTLPSTRLKPGLLAGLATVAGLAVAAGALFAGSGRRRATR